MEVSENKSVVVYEFGKFVLNPKERTLFVDGAPLHLPAKEFDTLLLLVEHNGHTLSKAEMLSAIWHDTYVEESNLAKQISRLRKLFTSSGEQFIETLPKHGYRFSADLRRTLVEAEDAVILEKRTVKRVTFAVEKETEAAPLALPPARRSFFKVRNVALILVAIIGLTYLVWHFRRNTFPSASEAVDPYAPVRLTDNPTDDHSPSWTSDGRIRFIRVYPDGRTTLVIMNADGTGQSEIKSPDGLKVFGWSPDERKMLYEKQGDPTKIYLANSDGSGEVRLSFRPGAWSADSKMLTYHQRVSKDNFDIFVYSIDSRESRNITNYEALDADPSFSPDGSRIVFVSTRDGDHEIYSVHSDGSNLTRLTFSRGIDSHPSFSPDGTQILFGSNRENENADVYVMNTDGGHPAKVTNWDKTKETAGRGAWSADGTKILFDSDRNGNDDVYVMSAETVRPKIILSDAQHDLVGASYSPDGNRLLYSKSLENRSGELGIFDFETRQSSLVRKTELPRMMANWSPDGNWIAFSDLTNGNSEVLIVRSDGSELQNLTNNAAVDAGPVWSPDGKRLLFVRGELSGASQLHIMNADGSGAHPVTPRLGWEFDASWFPDGTRILFSCDRTDSPGNVLDVCQINEDGTGERRLLFHRNHDVQPTVSPDGKLIAFVSHADGNAEIYVMNTDGSGLIRLTRNLADDQWPEWSPDGKKLMFISNRSGKFAIYEIGLS